MINPKAIINCHDFPDMKSIVEEIRRLDQDDEAFMRKLTEPILVEPDLRGKYLEEREQFIYHILEQPYASAFRRNRGLRGQWYNDFMCHMLGYPNEWFSAEKGYFVKAESSVGTDGPLVSILIPVYNRRVMVKEAINSALKQTYANIEIIVVDNCSTDGTYEELVNRFDSFEKVRIFRNQENIGPVNNWRACLERAKGKYVKFLFSDDLIRDNALESFVEVMEADPTVGLVYSSVFVFMHEDRNKGFMLHQLGKDTGRYEKDVFYKAMFEKEENLPVSPGCALFRREDAYIMEQIPNDLGVNCNANGAGIDLLIMLNALDKYENFYYIDETLSFFRYHESSITVNENLIREYNLAKVYFCRHSQAARRYLRFMYMRILRDEGIADERLGLEMLKRYGYQEGDLGT